jgi:hypothetical protein
VSATTTPIVHAPARHRPTTRGAVEDEMSSVVQLEAARLVLEERWAALATVERGAPSASMVAYAVEPSI